MIEKERAALTAAPESTYEYTDNFDDFQIDTSAPEYQPPQPSERPKKSKLPTIIIPTPEFVRVGDKYYQRVQMPDKSRIWQYRDKHEMKQDGIDLKTIWRFHGFVNIPDYQNHKVSVNDFLNLFEPLKWERKKGEWKTIEKLLRHIFGEHYELALDYLFLLLTRPKQILPILVVVSKLQGTGKSTLLRFLKALHGQNAVILKVAEYGQQFNGIFASKLVICIDETILSGEGIKEKLKADSTATTIQLRKMHTEHQTIDFYGKFILATNSEDAFAKVEPTDSGRFWVRKVAPIAEFDGEFDAKIESEIPAFLDHLLDRPMHVPAPLSRMYFSPEQLRTDALVAAMENSRSDCAKDIEQWADEVMPTRGEFGATIGDIYEALARRYKRNEIGKALREELGHTAPDKSRYYYNQHGQGLTGKAYTFGMAIPAPPEVDDQPF